MINYGTNNAPSGFTSVALGTFDGIHRGHFDVINSAVAGEKSGLIPCVVSFYPHPQQVLSGKAPPVLMTSSERETVLELMGVELCYILNFDEIHSLSAREFVFGILYDKLKVREISCGYDYRFGRGGSGNVEVLRELCREKNIKLNVIEPVLCEGERVSSTAIRRAIESGDIEHANDMLGRPFCYDFIVVGGNKNGRTIGFPTINQYFPDGFILPKFGVYASRTYVDGWWRASVTNFGLRPTVGSDRPISETCIIDYSGDLYGKNIRVELLEYIRPERKFGGLSELKEQIKTDTAKAYERSELKAVLFDFDDTLSDRKKGFMEYARYFLKKYVPDMTEIEIEKGAQEMNSINAGGYCDREKFFKLLVDKFNIKNPPPLEVFFDEYDTVFPEYTSLFDDTLTVFREIKRRGLKIGIITNGVPKMQYNKLRVSGVDKFADFIAVSGDRPYKKPDKRIFDYVISSLGIRNEQAIFVGDHTRNDIRGAKGAGINVVRMRFGPFSNDDVPDTVMISKIGELLDILK